MNAFFGEGGLGNQIFQFAFIRSAEPGPTPLLTTGFDDFSRTFKPVRGLWNLKGRWPRRVARRILAPLFAALAKARVITSYTVDTVMLGAFPSEDTRFTKHPGLLRLAYFFPCYAQSEFFFSPEALRGLQIREEHLEAARDFLARLPADKPKVFVHVRRGDYAGFSVLGKVGSALPLVYYQDAMHRFEQVLGNPFFVILTNDPEYVERSFVDFPHKVISRHSTFVDFAIMALCENGVLSNSSFSWWGAYFMKSRRTILGPKNWLGWKSGLEFPKGIGPSFAEMLDFERAAP